MARIRNVPQWWATQAKNWCAVQAIGCTSVLFMIHSDDQHSCPIGSTKGSCSGRVGAVQWHSADATTQLPSSTTCIAAKVE
jgi:hypothetical protein